MTRPLSPNGRAESPRQNGSAEREHCTLVQPLRAHIAGRILRALIAHEPPAPEARDALEIPDGRAVTIDVPRLGVKLRTDVAFDGKTVVAAGARVSRGPAGYELRVDVDPSAIVDVLFEPDARGIPANIRLLGTDCSGALQPTKYGLAMPNGVRIVRDGDGWSLACPLPADRLLELIIGD